MHDSAYAAMAVEAKFLREEIVANKRLVFERPLIIVSAAIAAQFVSGSGGVIEILLGVCALGFNLWFTVNRLASNARIIAYLQLVHDRLVVEWWVGWETALRLYRLGCSNSPPPRAEVSKLRFTAPQEDSLRFYGPIFYLPILAALALVSYLAIKLQMFTGVAQALATRMDVLLTLSAVALGLLIGLNAWRLRPGIAHVRIEHERQRWLDTFEQYVDPEPPPIGERKISDEGAA